MSTPTKSLIKFLAAVVAVLVAAPVLTFIVDPLQLFRPARVVDAMYSIDSRMQNAGLIHSQTFDTVFMGTSLAIHFRQSDMDKALGVRSLKLAMSGSNSHEQSFVLATAMERHPARVIWEMDDWIFRDAPEVDANAYIPADFYRRNARGIASYLVSGAMARESLWILARSVPPLRPVVTRLTNGIMFKFPLAQAEDINVLRPSDNVAEIYNAGKALAAFKFITDPVRSNYLAEGYETGAMMRNFERDAVALIAQNPSVTFDIYFPPYSILQFVAMRDASPTTLAIVYDVTARIAQRLTQLPNVRLYDFRRVKDVTHDLGNYSDVVHHSPAVDAKVLHWLARGDYRVDPKMPLASLDELKAQVEAYRVPQ